MPRTHQREFKLDLCRRIVAGTLTRSAACREHRLASSMLARWLDQFAIHGENSFQGQAWRAYALDATDRIAQLEDELRTAQRELKFLQGVLNKKKSQSRSESKKS